MKSNIYNTYDEIPKEAPGAKEITNVIKKNGKIVGYELGGSMQITKEEGVQMAKKGQIKNVGIAHRSDEQYLKSLPDSVDENNLSNM